MSASCRGLPCRSMNAGSESAPHMRTEYFSPRTSQVTVREGLIGLIGLIHESVKRRRRPPSVARAGESYRSDLWVVRSRRECSWEL